MFKLLSKLMAACGNVILAGGRGLFSHPQQRTQINERGETGNGTFKIRVTVYAEENG
jgi:hypothetical protein